MNLKNSMILANMMSKSGGVQFKTSIYATDNAYIQTDISANADYKIRVKGQLTQYFTDGSKTFCFLGSIYYDTYGKYTGTQFSVGYNPNISRNVISLRSYNNRYIYEPTYSNDISVSTILRPYSFDCTLNNTIPYNTNFVIFALSDFTYKSNDCIYIELIEIKDQNDNLIAELKPAIVNGESGMYDIIEEKFYGNANSVGSLVCE